MLLAEMRALLLARPSAHRTPIAEPVGRIEPQWLPFLRLKRHHGLGPLSREFGFELPDPLDEVHGKPSDGRGGVEGFPYRCEVLVPLLEIGHHRKVVDGTPMDSIDGAHKQGIPLVHPLESFIVSAPIPHGPSRSPRILGVEGEDPSSGLEVLVHSLPLSLEGEPLGDLLLRGYPRVAPSSQLLVPLEVRLGCPPLEG